MVVSSLGWEGVADTTTKRRIEIAFEKRLLVFLKQPSAACDVWCEGCGREVRMVSPEQAALITGVSSRTIYRWLENDSLHFLEMASGLSLICLRSLESRPVQPEGQRASKPKPFFKRGLMQKILKRRVAKE